MLIDTLSELQIYTTRLFCSLAANTGERTKEILAECAASRNIVNKLYKHLFTDFKECTGDIYGACGVSLGAVIGKGKINFMGVQMLAHFADTDVSVLSMGETAQNYGFKWTLQDSHMEVISRRTMDGAIIPIAGRKTCIPYQTNFSSLPSLTSHQSWLPTSSQRPMPTSAASRRSVQRQRTKLLERSSQPRPHQPHSGMNDWGA